MKKRELIQEAISYLKKGNLAEAQKTLMKALAQHPNDFDVLLNLGLVHAHTGKLAEAKQFFLKASSANPNEAEPHYNLGIIYSLEKNLLGSIDQYQQAIKLNPRHIEALTNLSDLFNQLERYEEALDAANQAVQLNSSYPETWLNQGKAFGGLQDSSSALNAYQKVLEIQPLHSEGLFCLAYTLDELQDYEGALKHYDLYLQHYSKNPGVLTNKGSTLNKLGRHQEALEALEESIKLNPLIFMSWLNAGTALHNLKQFDKALVHYDQALSLMPIHADGLRNKGNTLIEMKRYEDALGVYQHLLSAHPNTEDAKAQIFHLKMRLCDWSDYEAHYQNLYQACVLANDTCSPFISLGIYNDDGIQKTIAQKWVRKIFPKSLLSQIPKKITANQKIRVGYYSPDFKNHPVSFLIAELIELHDRNRFEVIAFSFGADNSNTMQDRLSGSFDQFINVQDKSEIEIASLSREMGIDIAIDLCGHTHENRFGIFCHRAAPIQVSYVGHPGTMGAECIDYIIADPVLIPLEKSANYSEKLIHLPHSFQINDRKREIAKQVLNRADFDLPQDGIVYCCFNNNFKITPDIFNCWMEILKGVDRSVIWLLEDTPAVSANLRKEATKAGIDPKRIIFAGRIAPALYLARYQLADIFLDTCPFNGGATASDALWAGLPIITKLGEAYSGRMAASLLHAIGLPELVTHTNADYITLAQDLGLDQAKLADIKAKLASNRLSTPLFNTPLNTKYIEAAFEKMMERHLNHRPPDHIQIAP